MHQTSDIHEQHMDKGKGKRSPLSLLVTNLNKLYEDQAREDFNGIRNKHFLLPFKSLLHPFNQSIIADGLSKFEMIKTVKLMACRLEKITN